MSENQQDFDSLLQGFIDLISDDIKSYAIQEMERQGLVEARVPSEYVVTEQGLEVLREWSS